MTNPPDRYPCSVCGTEHRGIFQGVPLCDAHHSLMMSKVRRHREELEALYSAMLEAYRTSLLEGRIP